MRLTTTSGGQTIQDYQYYYTQRGNVSSVIDNRNGVTYNYTYDDLHRLTTETSSQGGTTLSMDYDPLGNIVSKATAGNALAYTYGTAGRPHRLTSITQNGSLAFNYAYDANGNMTTGFDLANPSAVMQRSIVYNAENMPTQIDVFPYGGGTTTTYGFAYDATSKRVMKRIGMLVDTVYVGPHFEVANGVENSYIFAGFQRVAKVTSTATRYFHQDHLGSATRVTDETGALVEQAEYLPFGEMRAGSSSPPFASNYKYTDQEMDVGIGLYNYDARLYDPIIGRFISPDPIVPDPTNPQALNRYSYVLNNPLRYVDPTGELYDDSGPGGPPGYGGPPTIYTHDDSPPGAPSGGSFGDDDFTAQAKLPSFIRGAVNWLLGKHDVEVDKSAVSGDIIKFKTGYVWGSLFHFHGKSTYDPLSFTLFTSLKASIGELEAKIWGATLTLSHWLLTLEGGMKGLTVAGGKINLVTISGKAWASAFQGDTKATIAQLGSLQLTGKASGCIGCFGVLGSLGPRGTGGGAAFLVGGSIVLLLETNDSKR